MLPSLGGRRAISATIFEEEEYVPRKDEGYAITPMKEDADMGEPASLEDLNKAFAKSNANRLLLDELTNSKMKSTFTGNDSYNLNIFPTSQPSTGATLEEDWCSMNVETREQIGTYKDRLGRTVPIYMEKLPPRQFDEPQVTKATRNMELFTGNIPQEKKKETHGIITEAEEHPLIRYKRAAEQTIRRQETDLGSNKSHTQMFTQKDSCRDGYNGYNLKDGHETRARKLIDTNRNHYIAYDVSPKGTDEDVYLPRIAEKTTRVESTTFERTMTLGGGGLNDERTKRSIPILSGAKVTVKGRTGNESLPIDKNAIKSMKHRTEKDELNVYDHEQGQKQYESNMTLKTEKRQTNRQDLPENMYRQKGYETSTVCRGEVVPNTSIRDAFIINGKERTVPEHAECNVRSEQERDPGEDDPELETILIEQTLNDARIQSNIINVHDRTMQVEETYGEHGPEKMRQLPNTIPTNRSEEHENEHKINEPRVYLSAERSEQILGVMDATEQDTIIKESGIKQGRVHVPKERRLADKAKLNRDARMTKANVSDTSIRPGMRIVNAWGAQNISDFKQSSKFVDSSHSERPNVLMGSSDASDPNRLSGVKGFMQSLKHIVPNVLSKPQLASGTEQLKMPTGHLAMSSALPTISKTKELKEEIVQKERMGSSHSLLGTRLDYNMVPSHAKRGTMHVDRLTSNVYGKRSVFRDNWLPGLTDSKESGRGEHYRAPSAMSDAGSMCMPEMELKKDSKTFCNRF